jgi:hypothetical protein
MTPKEKAKELVDKYMFMEVPNYVSKFEIKLCALIAVNEIDKQLRINIQNGNNTKRYWLQVKQEIENL